MSNGTLILFSFGLSLICRRHIKLPISFLSWKTRHGIRVLLARAEQMRLCDLKNRCRCPEFFLFTAAGRYYIRPLPAAVL